MNKFPLDPGIGPLWAKNVVQKVRMGLENVDCNRMRYVHEVSNDGQMLILEPMGIG